MIIQLYIIVEMWQVFSFLHILVIFIDEIYDSIILCYYCWLLLFCLSNDSIFPNHNDISIYILYIPQIQYSSHFFFFFWQQTCIFVQKSNIPRQKFLIAQFIFCQYDFSMKVKFLLEILFIWVLIQD